jgi:hypothetical protein
MSSSGTTELPIESPEFGDDSAGTPVTLMREPEPSGSTPSARMRSIQGFPASNAGAFL